MCKAGVDPSACQCVRCFPRGRPLNLLLFRRQDVLSATWCWWWEDFGRCSVRWTIGECRNFHHTFGREWVCTAVRSLRWRGISLDGGRIRITRDIWSVPRFGEKLLMFRGTLSNDIIRYGHDGATHTRQQYSTAAVVLLSTCTPLKCVIVIYWYLLQSFCRSVRERDKRTPKHHVVSADFVLYVTGRFHCEQYARV